MTGYFRYNTTTVLVIGWRLLLKIPFLWTCPPVFDSITNFPKHHNFWVRFWNLEALIWVENGVDYIRLYCKFPKFSLSWPKSISIFGTHKRTPGCKKSAKSAILTSSMTVELLLVERSIVQSTNTNTNTQEYPEIPESKKDTRKYPTVYFNTPTRPEPDPLPGIFSNTRPDPIFKNPTR